MKAEKRTKRAVRWVKKMEKWNLICYVQEDQPKITSYWTWLRIHPWIRPHS